MTVSGEVTCVRFSAADREIMEAAANVVGARSVGAFCRTATVVLARAIVEASASGERGPGDRLVIWIMTPTLEGK